MILFLFGPNVFLLKRKLAEILSKYKRKYQKNIHLYEIDGENENAFSSFKEIIETSSMFKIKKLILFKNVFLVSKELKEDLKTYLSSKMPQIQDAILIFTQEGEVKADPSLFSFLKSRSFKKQEFKMLSNIQLRYFIKREIQKSSKNLEISDGAISKLIEFFGNNLWEITNEIKKLLAFKKIGKINEKDIEKISSPQISGNIFEVIQAIGERKKEKALKLIFDLRKKGQPDEKIFSMIVFQFRNLIKIKSYLLAQRSQSFSLKKASEKLEIHPFAFKKTLPLAKKFEIKELKKIYQNLFSLDFEIKTGKIKPQIAIDHFITFL